MNIAHPSILIQAANDCAAACSFCATSCLREADVEMMRDCIRLDLDCSDACRFLATLTERDSQFVAEFARQVGLVCEACGGECEKHDKAHCQQCAVACRRCAQACRSALST